MSRVATGTHSTRLRGDDHELRDPVAAVHEVRLVRVGVDEQDLQLAVVLGVDEPRRVEAGDAVAERQPRAGQDEPAVPGRDRDGDAGRDEGAPAAGPEADVLACREVVAGVVVVGGRGERQVGVEPADPDRQAQGARSPASSSRCSAVSVTSASYSGWSTTIRTGPSAKARCWSGLTVNFR